MKNLSLWIGLAALAASLTTGLASAQPAVEIIDSITLTRGSLDVTISATGTVLPTRQVPLAFEGLGVVAEVYVQQGDRVPAGTPIARLEASELERGIEGAMLALELQQIALNALTGDPRPEDIAAAEAAVEAAQASLNAAYALGSTTQADVAAIQAELARNQLWQAQLQRDIAAQSTTGGGNSLFSIDVAGFIPDDLEGNVDPAALEQVNAALNQALVSSFSVPDLSSLGGLGGSTGGSLTQAELGVQVADAQAAAAASGNPNAGSVSQANAALTTAQAQLDRLLNGATPLDIEAAQLGIDGARLAVEGAQLALSRMMLVAPFEGVIAQLNVRAGELPPTQGAAALLIDDSALFVDLAIDESDIVSITVGQPVNLRFDALPDTEIAGTVTRTAVTPTVIGQLVTYPVRVRVEAIDQPVRIGMSATATITVAALDDVLLLPNRFIRIDRESGAAFVAVETAPGQYEEMPVILGRRGQAEAEIVSGLDAGATVVLLPRGAFDLFDGPPGG